LERFQTWEITEGKMKGKLASFWILTFLFGCGLNTAGQGPDDDDQGPSDVPEQEAGPDIARDEVPEEDAAEDEDHFDQDGEDVPSETADEASPDEMSDETADSSETEDDGAEDETSAEDGETEDGEVTDPCAPPEIPTDGLYLFFCLEEGVASELVMWRWIYRDWGPAVIWETEPGCRIASSRTLFCPVEIYRDATYYFNIEMPGTGPVGWSCGPGLAAPMGTPRVWLYGIPVAITFADNGAGGCNHIFTVPEL
jgi:hypothetical protein